MEYTFVGYEEQPEDKISKTQSVVSAPIKGLMKGAMDLAESISPLFIGRGPLTPKAQKIALNNLLPTKNEKTEQILERAGSLAPYVLGGEGGAAAKGAEIATGTILGQLAKELGLGQTGESVAEAAGLTLPGVLKSARSALKAVKPEKLESGLPKLNALESTKPQLGAISEAAQEKTIGSLNEEAQKIADSIKKKHIPVATKLENIPEFKSEYAKRFQQIENVAKSDNVKINNNSVREFLNETAKKYEGIPELHPEAKKIISEIKSFSKKPVNSLYDGIKTYRSLNRKLDSVFEKSKLFGKQKEYVNFLNDYKKSLERSFENSLPQDSEFLRLFKDSNRAWTNISRAEEASKLIGSVFGKEGIDPKNLEKLASDKKMQARLKLNMDQKAAEDLVILAQDLKNSIQAIKKIPKNKSALKAMDSIFPLYFLIPGAHKVVGAAHSIGKGLKLGRMGYGRWLLSPVKRSAYKEALNAIQKMDVEAYSKAISKLLPDIEKPEKKEKFTFVGYD